MELKYPNLTKDMWALPPRGTTETSVRIGDDVFMQWTHLCEVEGCFAMAHSKRSPLAARAQIENHTCPAPPRRGRNPNGNTTIERMWNESDDAMDHFKAGTAFREMTGSNLQHYIMGIAECLSFILNGYFRITDDVLREMNRRWRMRAGEIPFSPTPGYRWNPPPQVPCFDEEGYAGSESPIKIGGVVPEKKPVKKATTKKAAPKVAFLASDEKPDPLRDPAIRRMITEAQDKVSAEDLAKVYGVDAERIETIWAIANTTKPTSVELIETPFLF